MKSTNSNSLAFTKNTEISSQSTPKLTKIAQQPCPSTQYRYTSDYRVPRLSRFGIALMGGTKREQRAGCCGRRCLLSRRAHGAGARLQRRRHGLTGAMATAARSARSVSSDGPQHCTTRFGSSSRARRRGEGAARPGLVADSFTTQGRA
jgi:hypothetical protein